jgi:hypothetical protein
MLSTRKSGESISITYCILPKVAGKAIANGMITWIRKGHLKGERQARFSAEMRDLLPEFKTTFRSQNWSKTS